MHLHACKDHQHTFVQLDTASILCLLPGAKTLHILTKDILVKVQDRPSMHKGGTHVTCAAMLVKLKLLADLHAWLRLCHLCRQDAVSTGLGTMNLKVNLLQTTHRNHNVVHLVTGDHVLLAYLRQNMIPRLVVAVMTFNPGIMLCVSSSTCKDLNFSFESEHGMALCLQSVALACLDKPYIIPAPLT